MKKKSIIGYFGLFGLIVMLVCTVYPKTAFRQDGVGLDIESNFSETESKGVFRNKEIDVPIGVIRNNIAGEILGENEGELKQKRIEVDLTKQKLYAIENGVIIHEFLISSGTWNRTPTGEFKIWAKIKSQKMSGGSRELGTYFYLPNVPNILFFYNDQVRKEVGYSIHGAYWHNQFGKPMSHGCVNMTIDESKVIFDWADMDTPIVIYGKMPIIQLPWAEN